MLTLLDHLEIVWGPLRLFGYTTVRAVLASVTAMGIGFFLAPKVFRRLIALKASESIRDAKLIGRLAEIHSNKKDIPSMGGVLIYLSIVPSVLLWAKLNVYVVVALIVYTAYTLLGFADDYLKIKHNNKDGLKSFWKLLIQAGTVFIAVAILLGNSDSHLLMSQLWIPFYKFPIMDEMPIILVFIFFFFVVAGTSNAINLTDGIDGLAIGCTIPTVLVYSLIAYMTGHAIIAQYLFLPHVPGASELSIVCSATLGAAVVFLWYNCHPAEIFMGDTGSLGLGGLIGSVAFMTLQPFTLVIIGGVFVMETLSVILQIISFKGFGKRIFRMAPIHHHFELKDWHENKVVIRFWILSLIFALIGLSSLKLR